MEDIKMIAMEKKINRFRRMIMRYHTTARDVIATDTARMLKEFETELDAIANKATNSSSSSRYIQQQFSQYILRQHPFTP